MKEIYIRSLEFLEKFGPVVILPIAILWLSQWWTKKQKKDDQDFELRKIKETKTIETDHKQRIDKVNHEKIVHSSLLKILFQVQKLHISVSGSCIDNACIDNAITDFSKSLEQYQNIISDNQLHLASTMTNNIYRFYGLIGELLIELREIRDKKLLELAIVSVWEYSQQLADCILEIQDELVQKHKDLLDKFNKLEMPHFRDCCGLEPPPELKAKIEQIRKQKDEIALEIQVVSNTLTDIKPN